MSMEELRAKMSESVLELFDASVSLIREINPDVVEVAWPHQMTAGFGVGPKKMSEQYNYIAVFSKHMNLGFYYGAELNDPRNVLTGTGKLMRSVRISSLNDLQQVGLRELLEQSVGYLPKLKSGK